MMSGRWGGFIGDGASALYQLFSVFWLFGEACGIYGYPSFHLFLSLRYGFDIEEQARIQDLLIFTLSQWII